MRSNHQIDHALDDAQKNEMTTQNLGLLDNLRICSEYTKTSRFLKHHFIATLLLSSVCIPRYTRWTSSSRCPSPCSCSSEGEPEASPSAVAASGSDDGRAVWTFHHPWLNAEDVLLSELAHWTGQHQKHHHIRTLKDPNIRSETWKQRWM